MCNNSKFFCAVTVLFFCSLAIPQDNEGPFKKLFNEDGFVVSFIFYSKGDGDENNGVVILLENKNSFNISYQFTLIFRAGNRDRVKTINGSMSPLEKRTGSNDRLYFIPFEDGRSISEVGIKNCKVMRN